MSSIEREEERGSVPIITDASRKRAAIETYSRHEEALRRTARRYSICVADADDALQRALEILLVKAPTVDPRELIRWSQTVVKHEALAIRRDRERTLSGPAAATPEPGREDWVALLPSKADGPPERAERQETIARSREALRALKPQELRALTLLAEGYSYKEIAAITGYSQTKINRCLAEGREKFRSVFTRSRDGSLCEEMRPLLSAFCDGEVGSEEEATLREHLRACAGCRATLRAYRAAPGAAAALLPAAPGGRSLFERAHDALAGLGARFSGSGSDSALSQVAASGGTRGAGMAALAKLAAICAATAGGAAACVATGIVPTPLALDREHSKAPVLERKIDPTLAAEWETGTGAESGPASITEPTAAAEPAAAEHTPAPEPAIEPAATPAAEPATATTEYVPPPEPAPVAASPVESTPASGAGGNPAGEFGP